MVLDPVASRRVKGYDACKLAYVITNSTFLYELVCIGYPFLTKEYSFEGCKTPFLNYHAPKRRYADNNARNPPRNQQE